MGENEGADRGREQDPGSRWGIKRQREFFRHYSLFPFAQPFVSPFSPPKPFPQNLSSQMAGPPLKEVPPFPHRERRLLAAPSINAGKIVSPKDARPRTGVRFLPPFLYGGSVPHFLLSMDASFTIPEDQPQGMTFHLPILANFWAPPFLLRVLPRATAPHVWGPSTGGRLTRYFPPKKDDKNVLHPGDKPPLKSKKGFPPGGPETGEMARPHLGLHPGAQGVGILFPRDPSPNSRGPWGDTGPGQRPPKTQGRGPGDLEKGPN